MSNPITSKQLVIMAREAGATLPSDSAKAAKRMRSFIRRQAKTDAAIIGACGQGNRYGMGKREADALVAAFVAAQRKGDDA